MKKFKRLWSFVVIFTVLACSISYSEIDMLAAESTGVDLLMTKYEVRQERTINEKEIIMKETKEKYKKIDDLERILSVYENEQDNYVGYYFNNNEMVIQMKKMPRCRDFCEYIIKNKYKIELVKYSISELKEIKEDIEKNISNNQKVRSYIENISVDLKHNCVNVYIDEDNLNDVKKILKSII